MPDHHDDFPPNSENDMTEPRYVNPSNEPTMPAYEPTVDANNAEYPTYEYTMQEAGSTIDEPPIAEGDTDELSINEIAELQAEDRAKRWKTSEIRRLNAEDQARLTGEQTLSDENLGDPNDVPFQLPHADEMQQFSMSELSQAQARMDDPIMPEVQNTFDANDDDVPFDLPKVEGSGTFEPTRRDKPQQAPMTRPHFKEPGTTDYKKTLQGSGGLDPAPAHFNKPSEPTIQSMGRVQPMPPPSPQPQPASVPRPDADYTMANPNVADDRYRRPAAQAPVQSAQGAYVPPPPGQNAQSLPKRRSARRIMGLRPGCLYMMLGLAVTFCGGFTMLFLGAFAIFVPRIEAQWSSQIDQVDNYRAFESTFIFDRNGDQLFESFGEGRRDTVPYERFPAHLLQATIATEDDSFYENIGIDIAATTLAFLQFVGAEAGEQTAGGSTITQQLVRNVLFDFEKRTERSVSRKAEEIILAILLTQRKSKQDILELYLNEIYYGNLAYGAQTAARTFFNKDVEDLTLGEAALLAGLPQAPASLDPLNPDPEVQAAVDFRWRLVLGEMVEEGFITSQQRDDALRQGLNFSTPEVSLQAPHFTVYAQNEFERLMENLGFDTEDVANGGYRIYTTIDQDVNRMAQQAAANQVASLQGNNVSNAAVIILKPLTGEIMGMVGSIDYNNDFIDGRVNVTTALRQPGSTMKPFTFAAALERGMTAGDVIWDTRTDIGIPGQPTYTPRNYDGNFHGPMTMRPALANSYNIPAVQTVRLIGVDYLLQIMNRFGVETLDGDPSQYGLSLTLGGGEVSLLELANAYGVFANLGSYVAPTSILCVVDNNDNIVYQYENGCPAGAGNFTTNTIDLTGFGTQVLDPRIAYTITDMLGDNVARTPAMGVNSPLRTDGIGTAVKTGTTNDVKDNWTIGYTRNLVVGVWVGNNNGDPMVNSSGLTGAAPIWNAVTTGIYNNQNLINSFRVDGQLLPDTHNTPQGMSRRQICDVRNLTDPSPSCSRQISEWMLDGPVGIPDSAGNLQYVDTPPIQGQAPNGAYLQEVSPDVYRALVYRIPDQIAAGIQFQLQPGDKRPPAPRYCRVTPDIVNVAQGAQELVFIAGPTTSQGDAVEAENYAQARNLAFLPTIDCWADVFNAVQQPAPGGELGVQVVTAVISSPANGQTIARGPLNIIGTIQYGASQVDYYHLDLIGGQWTQWTALGEEMYNPIVDGTMWQLDTSGFAPGQYGLRVRLHKNGGWMQQPYEVFFTVQ